MSETVLLSVGNRVYRLHASAREVGQALLAFNPGLSVAEVQLLMGHSDTTLRLWLARAGLHAQRVHQHFFQNLRLGQLQFDELHTTLRNTAHEVRVAFDPMTKLMPAVRLGPRTQVLAPGCVPVCTSDGLNLYFYALTAHFGAWFADPATGKMTWRVALALLYGQVKKSYRRRKIFKVERRMQLGQLEDLQAALQGMGFTGTLNTAFVERINLTLRHALAASLGARGLRRNSRRNSRSTWKGGELITISVAHLKAYG